ncbi:MAG: carboxypeptidase-like regulatory domain-containing protein [bacterium]
MGKKSRWLRCSMTALWLGVLLSQLCLSQTETSVVGMITDQSSQKPISGVNVIIRDTKLGAMTDSLGFYEIRHVLPGLALLEVRHVGYRGTVRPIIINEGERNRMNFELEQKVIQLPAVTVEDSTRLERLKHQFPSAHVVTRHMILRSGAVTMGDLLRDLMPDQNLYFLRKQARKGNISSRFGSNASTYLIIDNHFFQIPVGGESGNDYNWLDRYIGIDQVETMFIHRGYDAWVRVGKRGQMTDYVIEIMKRKVE